MGLDQRLIESTLPLARPAAELIGQLGVQDGLRQLNTKAELDAIVAMGEAAYLNQAAQSLAQIKQYALEAKKQGLASVRVQLSDKASLSDVFPGLRDFGLDVLSFSQTSLTFRFEGTDDDLPGVYFATDVALDGALEDAAAVFETLLGTKRPVLRLHAFLGAAFEDDDSLAVDSLLLSGELVDIAVCNPGGLGGAVLRSLGLEVRFGAQKPAKEKEALQDQVVKYVKDGVVTYAKKYLSSDGDKSNGDDGKASKSGDKDKKKPKEKSAPEKPKSSWIKQKLDAAAPKAAQWAAEHIQLRIFGVIDVPVLGQDVPLALDFQVKNTGTVVKMDLSPMNDKSWDDAFGFDWLDLENVYLSATLDVAKVLPKLMKPADDDKKAKDDKKSKDKKSPDDQSNEKQQKTDQKPEKPSTDDMDVDEKPNGKPDGKPQNGQHKRQASTETPAQTDKSQPPKKKAKKPSKQDAKKALDDARQKMFADKDLFDELEDSDDEDEDDAKQDKKKPDFLVKLHAEWNTGITANNVVLDGQICGDKSFLCASLKGLTLDDLAKLYAKTHGQQLDTKFPVRVCAQELAVKISSKGIKLKGDITIEDKKCVGALFRLSTKGLVARAELQSLPFEQHLDKVEFRSAAVLFALRRAVKDKPWAGVFGIAGSATVDKKVTFGASFTAVRLDENGWGFVLVGQSEMQRSLSDIDSLVAGGCFDFQLNGLALVASSVELKSAALTKAVGYPINKGVYLYSRFERIPFLEDAPATDPPATPSTSTPNLADKKDTQPATTADQPATTPKAKKAVKPTTTPAKGTPCYLAIGINANGNPRVYLELAGATPVTLPPIPYVFEAHTKIERLKFQLQLDPNTGVSGSFNGAIRVKFAQKEPVQLELELKVTPTEGHLGAATDYVVRNPLGISDKIALGRVRPTDERLAVAAQYAWGAPFLTGGGFSSTVVLADETRADACVYLGANPLNTIISGHFNQWRWQDMLVFLDAMLPRTTFEQLKTHLPEPVDGLAFENMQFVASAGAEFLGETYPRGITATGTLKAQGKAGLFKLLVNGSGLQVEARLPEFALGPFKLEGYDQVEEDAALGLVTRIFQDKVKGPVRLPGADTTPSTSESRKYLLWKVHISLDKQTYTHKGRLRIYDSVVDANTQVQILPSPACDIFFLLNWSEVCQLQVVGKVIDGTLKAGQPEQAGFHLTATATPQVHADVRNSINNAIARLPEQAKSAVAALQAQVEASEAALRDLAEQKQEKETALADKKQELDRNVAAADAKTAEKQAAVDQTKQKLDDTAKTAAGEKTAATTKAESDKQRVRDDKQNCTTDERTAAEEYNKAQESLVNKIDYILGQIRVDDQSRRQIREYLLEDAETTTWRLNVLKEQIIRETPWFPGSSTLIDSVFNTINDYRNSEDFKACQRTLVRASTTYDTARARLNSAAANLPALLEKAEQTAREVLAEIQTRVDQAQRAYNKAKSDLTEQIERAELDKIDWQAAFADARRELAADIDGLGARFQALRGAASADALALQLKDAQDKLPGILRVVGGLVGEEPFALGEVTFSAFAPADMQVMRPFDLRITGTMGGQPFAEVFSWTPWSPGADSLAFFKELGDRVVAYLGELAAA